MSANPVARPHSRRAILAGLSSLPALGAVAVAAPLDPADIAFTRWLEHVRAWNADELGECSDRDDDPIWVRHSGNERAICALPPSEMAAAAIALLEMHYEIDGPDKGRCFSNLMPDDTAMTLARILTCLRPKLSGIIADITADLLDNPERPFSASALVRIAGGKAPLNHPVPAAIVDKPDPVLALVAAEQKAWERLEARSGIEDCQDDPEWEAASDAQYAALAAVCSATPTTAAGLSAMLDTYWLRNKV